MDVLTKYPFYCWKGSRLRVYYLVATRRRQIPDILHSFNLLQASFAAHMICDQYSHLFFLIKCKSSQNVIDQSAWSSWLIAVVMHLCCFCCHSFCFDLLLLCSCREEYAYSGAVSFSSAHKQNKMFNSPQKEERKSSRQFGRNAYVWFFIFF